MCPIKSNKLFSSQCETSNHAANKQAKVSQFTDKTSKVKQMGHWPYGFHFSQKPIFQQSVGGPTDRGDILK